QPVRGALRGTDRPTDRAIGRMSGVEAQGGQHACVLDQLRLFRLVDAGSSEARPPEHDAGASQFPNGSHSDASVTSTAVPRSTDTTSSGFPSFSISRSNTPHPHGCKAAVVVAPTHR